MHGGAGRVWTIAAAAGVAAFAVSIVAQGLRYDEREGAILDTTAQLAQRPEDILLWNRLAELLVRSGDAQAVEEQVRSWRRQAPASLVQEQPGEAMLLYRVGSRLERRNEAAALRAFAQTVEDLEAFTRRPGGDVRCAHWHTLAHALQRLDRDEQALAVSQRTADCLAQRLDRGEADANLALVAYWLGEIRARLGDRSGAQEAWRLLLGCLERVGQLPQQGEAYTWQGLAKLALRDGARDVARRALGLEERRLTDAVSNRRLLQSLYELGWVYDEAGFAQEAGRVWTELARAQREIVATQRSQRADGLAVGLYNLACYEALAGRREQALAALEEALQAGFANTRLLDEDRDLRDLRSDERFAQLAAGVFLQRAKGLTERSSRAELRYLAARALARAGLVEQALEALEGALEEGFRQGGRMRSDPALAPLRSQERFKALLERAQAGGAKAAAGAAAPG